MVGEVGAHRRTGRGDRDAEPRQKRGGRQCRIAAGWPACCRRRQRGRSGRRRRPHAPGPRRGRRRWARPLSTRTRSARCSARMTRLGRCARGTDVGHERAEPRFLEAVVRQPAEDAGIGAAAVEIGGMGDAHGLAGLREDAVHRRPARLLVALDGDRAPHRRAGRSSPKSRSFSIADVERQEAGPVPARAAEARPAVEVGGRGAHGDGGVDHGGPADQPAPRQADRGGRHAGRRGPGRRDPSRAPECPRRASYARR